MSVLGRGLVIAAKVTAGILAMALVLLVVLYFLLHNSDPEVRRYTQVPSPDGSYRLVIDVGNPSMPYGPHTVYLAVIDASDRTVVSEQYRLSNDGSNIGNDNIEAHWSDPGRVELCLRGDEQTDVFISIQVSGRNVVRKDRKC